MSTWIVIPAAIGSSRLPEKPLLAETGKPLVVETIIAASKCSLACKIVVATDSPKIVHAVSELVPVILDTSRHDAWCGKVRVWCGTVRVANAIERMTAFDESYTLPGIVVNLQVDEPEIDGASLDMLIDYMQHHPRAEIATLVAPLPPLDNTPRDVVKVLINRPFCTDFTRDDLPLHGGPQTQRWYHIGIYAYRTPTLRQLATLRQSDRSKELSLEQLTWLDAGWQIHAVPTDRVPSAINTPADYRDFVRRHHHARRRTN